MLKEDYYMVMIILTQIDDKYLDKEEIVVGKPRLKINRDNINEEIEYNLGEHVKHEKYGEGVIIGIESSILTIAFPHPHDIVKIHMIWINHKISVIILL